MTDVPILDRPMGVFSTASLRRFLSITGWLLATAVFWIGCNSRESTRNLDIRGRAMGTSWQVILPRFPSAEDAAEIKQEIIAKLERVESQMSHWREDSLVSRFNQSDSTRPLEITKELAAVLKEAQRTYELTDGAFDITAAPLVDLWGFGPAGRQQTEPSAEQIEAVQHYVGTAHLHLSEEPRGSFAISKRIPKLRIDMSALAKGYAIDLIAEHLDAHQFEDYLIEIGGELRAKGANASGTVWQIGLEQPDPNSIGQVRNTIALQNQAIATSGSYRNVNRNSKANAGAYSHIIDPRTGRPVTHDLVSVSVIASNAMRADAWATALMVLGPDKGFETAGKQKIAASFVINSSSGFRDWSTEFFDAERVRYAIEK